MNKNVLSLFIIVVTITSCFTMIYNSDLDYNTNVEVVNLIEDNKVDTYKQEKLNQKNIKKEQYDEKCNKNIEKCRNKKESLSLSDKKKLLKLAEKLSAIDYSNIEENLKSNNVEKNKKAIELLKSRFTYKEYKKVKFIERKIS